MTDAEDLNLASKLFTEGRYAEAGHLCAAVVARSPKNSRAFYLRGLTFFLTDQIEKAAEQFHQAVSLNPKDYDSLYNLGVACGKLDRHDDAIAAYQTLLSKAPHYMKALPNLGLALVTVGRYDEGIASFKQALERDPKDVSTAALLLEAECLYLPVSERIACCNAALAHSGVSEKNRYIALIYRATAQWIMQDAAATAASLSAAANLKVPSGDQGIRNLNIFATFLAKLLPYRQLNQSLYAGEGSPLFLVGDSHSLSYAGIRLALEGVDYKIDSHLIIGTKAWHLASEKPNPRKSALVFHLNRLPQGAQLICSFGEIDCRIDHGILPYWKKSGGSLEAIVAEQVEKYVASLTGMAAQKSLRLIFLSIPAPHPASGERQKVIALFNKGLEKHVSEAGHHYVDLYAPTLGSDGFSHGNLHIDSYHLKPEALIALTKS